MFLLSFDSFVAAETQISPFSESNNSNSVIIGVAGLESSLAQSTQFFNWPQHYVFHFLSFFAFEKIKKPKVYRNLFKFKI